jgi:hypothetical protein
MGVAKIAQGECEKRQWPRYTIISLFREKKLGRKSRNYPETVSPVNTDKSVNE